ncbi:hypothetical protein A3K73_05710 [Candidatus Pacearchaeota archaeon RBG_13_36_9]|nr:MAG: hypothetical protein A3K73_05710 [Candidatus Pacearchaeota archaeon RBG_13_36_9]
MLKELIEGFKKGQKAFGEDIAAIVNSVILSVVYIFGVGLTSIMSKIAGKSFLHKRFEEEKKSYWSDLNLTRKELKEYCRQF